MIVNYHFTKYPRYIFRKQLALELIKKYVPKGSYFLDVGCSNGDFSFSLANLGYQGHMIDFSKEAVKIIQNKLMIERKYKLTVEEKDIFKYGNTELKFDLVMLFEILEHVKRDSNLVKKAYSLLKSRGYLVLSVPARKKFWSVNDKIVGHIRRYEKADLIRILSNNGFGIIKLYSYGYPFLNFIRPLNIMLSKYKYKDFKGKSQTERTKQSGLNFIKMPFISLFFNKYTLYPIIQISKLFSSCDLSNGYLCLARRKD